MNCVTQGFKDAFRSFAAKRAEAVRISDPGGRQRALIAPASNPGSLGDAAMIIGLITLLKGQEGCRVALASDEVEAWQLPFEVEQFGNPPAGGFSWLKWGKALADVDSFFLNGADVLDGNYSVNRSLGRIRLVEFAAKAGIPTTITGFSLREDIPKPIKDAFRRLPSSVRLCMRDPVSKRRMDEIVGRECHQVADLAFLMQPELSKPEDLAILERIKSEQARGRTVIGFCPNLHAVAEPELGHAERCEVLIRYFEGMVEGCRELGNYFFVLIPHDYRGKWNDAEVSRRIFAASALSEADGIVVEQELLPSAVKGIVGSLDTLVTGRMHCGIAALGGAVPTIFMDYQGKVDGLLEFFNLETKVKITRDVTDACKQTAMMLREMRNDNAAYRERIRECLAHVKGLSAGNWGKRNRNV